MYFKLVVLFISVLYVQSEPTCINGQKETFITRLKSLASNENNSNRAIVLKPFFSKEVPDRSLCGTTNSNNNTIESDWTQIDKFPWVVALIFKNKETGRNEDVKCSGTIINRRFVLTAARCVTNKKHEVTHVRLGDWSSTADPDCADCNPGQIVKITKKIPHLFYDGLTQSNDIALLRLQRDIEFNDDIRPICLPPQNLPAPEEKTRLIVSGWGSALDGNAKSKVKLEASVPFISNVDCNKILPNVDILANHMCAGGDSEKNACKGDSGGPLMRQFLDKIADQMHWYQEGIVSLGEECDRVGVYTRISRYVSWIITILETK